MGSKIKADKYWQAIDIDETCRLFETTPEGTEVRQRNTAEAVRAIVGPLNHCLANTARVIARQSIPYVYRPTDNPNPACRWAFDDRITNARDQQWRLASYPRSSGSGAGFAYREGDSSTRTQEDYTNITGASFPEDVSLATIDYERGDKSDTTAPEGLSLNLQFPYIDFVVQEQPIAKFDTDLHDYAIGKAVAGQSVIETTVERMVEAFNGIRQNYHPTFFSWLALGTAAGWATPGASNENGIRVTATSLTNVFDGSSTSRTATTEGLTCHAAYMAGRGAESQTDGTKVACKCYAFIDPGTSNCSVRFEGPNHVASNFVDLTAPGGTGPLWYSDTLYLNSSVEDDTLTLAGNKIDVYASVASGGDTAYIYALIGIGVYNL